ncbi:hypothetical protein ATE84_1106 [Aquimarina sp. MAR_2010_214]|uniref:hypothetical protein n=1 Tax=Aquimarina sp. MAR_2010_214 TaxID=1250026 RepID=UPI000C707DFA|nr:hypothetical protein [Aquimarina sp. MAR_2010_214]PKV49090.1 hypothetical protein ATE84_1106 [Aquimarina sp. MAR_2010_214]
MRNLLKFVFLFVIAFLIANCQKDELSVENDISQKAKSWYESNHNQKFDDNLNFYGSPDWDNHFQVEDDIYFPLIPKLINTKNKIKLDDLQNKTYAKSYLVLTIDKNNFKESLKVFLNTNDSFKDIKQVLKLPYIEYKYSSDNNGIISKSTSLFQPNNTNIYKEILNPSTSTQITSKSRCQTYYVIKTTYVDSNPVHIDILYSYEVCGSGGGGTGGGGSGGGGDHGDHDSLPTADEEPTPVLFFTDCKSFEYAKVFGQNIAATIGINESFHADHRVLNGIMRRTIETHIDVATFVAPSALRPGQAANLTAMAVASANINTQLWFSGNTGASELQVKIQWEIHLKKAMKAIGGSIDIGKNTYGVRSPAPYLIAFTPTNCD